MASDKNKDNDEFIISFSDLVGICKRNKKKIYFGTFVVSALAVLNTLTNPIEYIAEATFRDKAKAGGGFSTLSLFLGSGIGGGNDDAISLMKSRSVNEELVKRLGIQATVVPMGFSESYPQMIWQNLIVEKAIFNSSQVPSLPDLDPTLRTQEVFYADEVPKGVSIKFLTEDVFEIYDGEVLKGRIDEPVKGSNYEFTLVRTNRKPLKGQLFVIVLNPLESSANNIAKQLRVEPDRLDKNLLNIKYGHRDRHFAVEVVNTLTNVYKDFLREEQNRIIGHQIAYLEQRQEEIADKLKETMESHVHTLSEDMKNIGFANTKIAMDFLNNLQNQFQQKLLNIEFETKRLSKAQEQGYAYYDGYSITGDPAVINQLLTEMRNLKQQGDWLDLALNRTSSADPDESQVFFDTQIQRLERNRQYRQEAKEMIAQLEQGKLPSTEGKLLQDPLYLVNIWHNKLVSVSQNLTKAPEEWQHCQTQFCIYLNNLVHHFDVHENAMQERLVHQQNGNYEYDGIDLNTARELYLSYSRNLNEIESQILQHQFIIDKMHEPEFELSSLSMVMNDYITNDMIVRSNRLAIDLKDSNNRSVKEQERLKEDIDLQKRHLTTHLKNAIELLHLKQDLVKYKIARLQNVTLGLIQQQVTLLEKHLKEYIATRLTDLKQESDIIEDHKIVLRNQMAVLPKKWVSEMLIDQQMEVNRKMVEEVSRLVESKIIGNNIEISQSDTIDKAIPPLHPKSPRVIFFAILGAFMGAFLSTTFVMVRELAIGINASVRNLRISGQHVSGVMTSRKLEDSTHLLKDQDLDTLRRLVTYLSPAETQDKKSLLIVQGRGPDYANNLATLLSKKGLRVLLFTLSFDQPAQPEELPGLLQFLEGEAPQPKIHVGAHFDTMSAGGISRFSNELLGKQSFQELLNSLKKHYDWIIGVSHTTPEVAETESLMRIFDHSVINITDEKLEDIKGCIRIATENEPLKKVSFILS